MSDGTRRARGDGPGLAITVADAGLKRVAELAELNRQLRDDEGYPDPMTPAQLVERMTNWLQDGYRYYLALQDGHTPPGPARPACPTTRGRTVQVSHNMPAVAFYRAYGFHIAVLRMEK